MSKNKSPELQKELDKIDKIMDRDKLISKKEVIKILESLKMGYRHTKSYNDCLYNNPLDRAIKLINNL